VETWAHVCFSSRFPKRTLPRVGALSGVVPADALSGSSDIIAIVKGGDTAAMYAVIDEVAEISGGVTSTDSNASSRSLSPSSNSRSRLPLTNRISSHRRTVR